MKIFALGGYNMNLFLSIITDLLFVLCIFLICNYFLMLDKTEYKYWYVLSTVITIFSIVSIKQNRLISCISITIVILFVIGVKQVTSNKQKEQRGT